MGGEAKTQPGLVIAVDGPSGAGKSTTARGVATRLGLRYLDTGAMYRAVTWWLLRRGVDVHDMAAVAALAGVPRLEVGTDPAMATIRIDGTDVAAAVRSAEVTAAVSAVSAVPRVRSWLVSVQQSLIGSGGIVVEGRDIGTVVEPDAALKVYLTATTEVRGKRRAAELTNGTPATAAADLARRDRLDSRRPVAPLAPAADAVHLDTSQLSLDEVIDAVVAMTEAHTHAESR